MDLADRFDEAAAEKMIAVSNEMAGIPGYLGLQLLRFAPSRLWAKATLPCNLVTPSGNVHGGAIAAILDHITGAVVYPYMPDGWWGATTELKLNYIAPVSSVNVDADATILALTNRTAVVRGEAYCNGRLVCAAQGTIALVAPRSTVAAV